MNADQKAAVEALSKERGVNANDAIVGNGTRAGYVLSYPNVVPNSETVTVDGSSKLRNRDYYLDNVNGTLMFLDPVKPSQMVRVVYRYVPGKAGERKILGGPMIALNLGQNTSLGVTYAYRSGQAAGQDSRWDILTFGANLTTTLGAKSSMTNMYYTSSAKDSGRVSLQALQNRQASPAQKPKSGDMLLHSSNLSFGKLSVTTEYQDVGEHFSGFASLREQGAAAADVLNRLEKEKGITRLGINANLDLGGGATTGLGFSTIEDKGGNITRQSLNIGNDRIRLSAKLQEIDAGFARFGGLSEPERDQWAKEKGMKRSSYQLSLAPGAGMGKDASWNGLAWSEVSDRSGKLSMQSLSFAGKGFSLAASQTSVDEGFKRLGSLSADDLKGIALRIRREFDPNATEKNLTKEDMEHAARETGIERRNIAGNLDLSSGKVSLQMLDVGDGSSGLSRQSFGFQGKDFSFSGFMQQVDEGFKKLGMLSPTEKANFGNEYGMDRMNFSGSLNLKSGLSIASSFARVGDDSGDVMKYGISVKGSNFDLRANYQNIDPEFTRVMDLADADRQSMAAEQGMKRYDMALNYRFSKALSFQSFWYDAQHSTQDKFRRQLRNQIDFNPSNGPKIMLFRYEDQAGASEANRTFVHETYKLDHDMKLSAVGPIEFRSLMDIKTTTEADGSDKQIKVSKYHLNNDPKQRIRFTGDVDSIEDSDGTYEKVQHYTLGANLTSSLAFSSMRKIIDTHSDSTVIQDYALTGKVFGGYALAARFGDTIHNGSTVGRLRELSIAPPSARDWGIFKGVNWSFRFAELSNREKVVTRNEQASVESTVLKHKVALGYSNIITKEGQTPTVRTVNITGDPDPKRRLHYSFAYKALGSGAGSSRLVRNYDVRYTFNSSTCLSYLLSSNAEKEGGKFEPVSVERLKLTTGVARTLALNVQWENLENVQNRTDRDQYSLGLAGKLSSLSAVEVSYGYDRLITPSGKSTANTYKVKYDHNVSADKYLTLSGTYTDWDGPKPTDADADDLKFQVDMNLVFN